jgi:hypothetical protein
MQYQRIRRYFIITLLHILIDSKYDERLISAVESRGGHFQHTEAKPAVIEYSALEHVYRTPVYNRATEKQAYLLNRKHRLSLTSRQRIQMKSMTLKYCMEIRAC